MYFRPLRLPCQAAAVADQVDDALETAARLARIREPQRFTSMVDARPTVAAIVETYTTVLTGQRRRG